MTQKRTSSQTTSQTGSKGSFRYSRSLSAQKIAQAQDTAVKGRESFNTVNDILLEWGQELLKWQRDLKGTFNSWVGHYFPDGRKEAKQAMAIAGLMNRLPQHVNEMMGWNRSALAALSKLSDEQVVEVLQSGMKWTVKAIKELKRSLKTGEPNKLSCATEEDWQRLVWDNYKVEESERNSMREWARNLAQSDAGEGETEKEVKVGHIEATVDHYKKVLVPVFSHRRTGKSGAAPISMKDYGEMTRTQERHLELIRQLKEEKFQLQQEDKERDRKSLEWARQEVDQLWQRKMALVQAQLRRVEEERNQLALEKEALAAEIASMKASATENVARESESGVRLEGAVVVPAVEEEERQLLVAQLRRSEEEKEQLIGEKEALEGEREQLIGEKEALEGEREQLIGEKEALEGERERLIGEKEALEGEREQLIGEKEALEGEIASMKASAGTDSDGDAGVDKNIEVDPQEVEEVAACFEMVFGERAVRKLHVSEVLSSLEKPVLETLQLLVEGLRRQAKFFQPYGSGNVRQPAPKFEDDFAFDECQIPPDWEPA
ncbi:hypothetical protein [Kamptonema formosum]|uniref:hypothetical protein n=1 Tax=Kamptonema formosum TaxID=331992 RepID=UPI00037DF52F|nr:hypothetical protein [Oscillatoria sp. PCC 10802]